MAFELIKAEIGLLMGKLAERPGDSEELEFLIREKIGQLKAFGMPLPADLVELEAMLDQQLSETARQHSREQPGGR